MRTLIVEDEMALARLLAEALERSGYETTVVHRGDTALERARAEAFDALVLDLSLPGIDGLEVLRQLRAERNLTPALVLTARGSVEERIEGLYSGADDYLAKPCDLDEVVARIHALVRRAGARPGVIAVGDLTLDVLGRDARRAGQRLDLTEREFTLLEALARSAGIPLTRMQLLERVFGYRVNPGTNIIEVHIKNLRKKVDAGFGRPLIHTVPRVGYVLQEEPSAV
jgi:two-component system, OmpR family, response regulator